MLPGGPEVQDRGPLFHGVFTPYRDGDQLQVILELIGTPPDSVSSLRDARAGIAARFPYADPDALDLVERMLRFDPHERISVDESLGHAALAEFRDEAGETVALTRISLGFEQENYLDEEFLMEHFCRLTAEAGGA